VNRIHLAQNRYQCCALVNTIVNLRIPWKAGSFLFSQEGLWYIKLIAWAITEASMYRLILCQTYTILVTVYKFTLHLIYKTFSRISWIGGFILSQALHKTGSIYMHSWSGIRTAQVVRSLDDKDGCRKVCQNIVICLQMQLCPICWNFDSPFVFRVDTTGSSLLRIFETSSIKYAESHPRRSKSWHHRENLIYYSANNL
jgi:hypothetical protein